MTKASEFTSLREQAGLDVRQAAELVAVSERMAYRYEEGTSAPSRLAMRTLKHIAETRLSEQLTRSRN